MAFKFISLMLVMTACIASQTQAAATKKSNERVAAVYVKDGNSGELRFLGAGLGTAQINNYITNKQNLLEQLRPNNNWGTGTGGTLTPTGGTLTPTGGTLTPTGGTLTPVPTGGTLTATPTGGAGAGVGASSPIAQLLPQIIAQATVQQNGAVNRRRVPNRRRVNRRRPARRGVKRNGNKNGQIYIIRPRA